MVTGLPPFRGRHAVEVLNAVINSAPRPIRDLNPKAPAALQPILDRALAKDPKDRYQTMAALRDELKALMRRLSRETGGRAHRGLGHAPAPAARAAPPGSSPARSGACWAGSRVPRARRGPDPGAARAPSRPSTWGSEGKADPRRPALQEPHRRSPRQLLRVLARRRRDHGARPPEVAGGAPLRLHRPLRGAERGPAPGGRGAGRLARPRRRRSSRAPTACASPPSSSPRTPGRSSGATRSTSPPATS